MPLFADDQHLASLKKAVFWEDIHSKWWIGSWHFLRIK